jgi:hypothetical protein
MPEDCETVPWQPGKVSVRTVKKQEAGPIELGTGKAKLMDCDAELADVQGHV